MKKRSVSLLGSYRVFGPPEQSLTQALSAFKIKLTTVSADGSIDADQFLFPESSSDEVSISSDSDGSFSDVGASNITEIEPKPDEETSNSRSNYTLDTSSLAESKISNNQLDGRSSTSPEESMLVITPDSAWSSETNIENGSLSDATVDKNSNTYDDTNSQCKSAKYILIIAVNQITYYLLNNLKLIQLRRRLMIYLQRR